MDRGVFKRIVFYALFVLCIALFVVSLVRTSVNGKEVNLLGFLDNLSKTESHFYINYQIVDNPITEDWGLFNFLRNFFNSLGTVFSVLGWLAINLINLILFIGQFVVYLFTF